jgi:hypothetical protein
MGNSDTRTKNSSQVELTITHSPLAFIYRLFVPTVTINGTKERRPWGVHTIELLQIVGPYLEDRTTIKFAELSEREFGGFVPPPKFAG